MSKGVNEKRGVKVDYIYLALTSLQPFYYVVKGGLHSKSAKII